MERTLPIEIVLKQNEGSFSKKEKLISDFILKNIDNYKKIKIQTIRNECQVGSATLYSFFNKIHIKSIYDLWTMISEENAIRNIQESEISNSTVEKMYQNMITKNSHIISPKTLQTFIEYLTNANNIYIIGLSTSNLAAIEFSRRLNRFGFSAFAIDPDPGEMIVKTLGTKPNDLLISMSMSGESNAVIYATQMAKKNDCKIISVTGTNKSSLSALANFQVSLFPAPFGNNDSTLISPLISYAFFIDSLIAKMLENDFSYYMDKRKKIATDVYQYTKK